MRSTKLFASRCRPGPALAATILAVALAGCQGSPEPPRGIGQAAPITGPAPVVPAGQVTLAFEPFTGIPGNIADELARDIGIQARQANLTLVRRVGATATYRVNGYLSATSDRSSTTVFYVFDIVDASGRRVNRVSGTETASGGAGDPWSSVDSSTLTRIAQRSVSQIQAWINRG
ncbi:hypothetical protein GCM10011316_03880 [Roseibium aquae]|uniref:Lipoprotein n=1 Tax=Roseibium aquae TaxID=1323746 RepID=A0A916WW98_9HYPH|nr:hypothetical protein [Roseibium aquae]GGB34993.1 hypothetical protein GCM10011316_03880 [Roseibium aquae]